MSTWFAERGGVVTTARLGEINPVCQSCANDVGLGHGGQGSMDGEMLLSLHGCLGGEIGQALERCDELWAAIRVAAVVQCVDTDEDVLRANHLGKSQRKTQKNGVARRYIGHRDRVAGL